MLGVEKYRFSSQKYFYNAFVSQILFDQNSYSDKVGKETNIELCLELLEKVALVRIELTTHDVLRFRKYLDKSLTELVQSIGKVHIRKRVQYMMCYTRHHFFSGGLMALYVGFSFLTLIELVLGWLRVCLSICVRE